MANAACPTTTTPALGNIEKAAADAAADALPLPCSLQVDADAGPPVVYREFAPPADLQAYVVCTWTLDIRPGVRPHRQNILPDGCADIIWIGDARPFVVGPMTRPALSTVTGATKITGVRFRPEATGMMLGVPANELTDRKIDLDELWQPHLADAASEELSAQRSAEGRIVVAQTLIRSVIESLIDTRSPSRIHSRIHSRMQSGIQSRIGLRTASCLNHVDALPDPLVQYVIARLASSRPDGIGDLARQAGISERQLRRRFLTAAGYSPKMFQRIVRFQRLLALAKPHSLAPTTTTPARLSQPSRSTRPATHASAPIRPPRLGDAAHLAGYADQAHMTREVAEFAGVTPSALLGKVDSALALYDLLHAVG